MIIGAKKVIPSAGELIVDGAICVEKGRVIEVGKKDEVISHHPYMTKVDLADALITPALVNFHCHLELEFCRGKVPFEGNFVDWLQKVRDLKHDFFTLPGYFPEASVKETLASGVTTIIDHYTMELNFEAIFDSGLRYLGLRELFEFNNHHPVKERIRESSIYSFAPHSPYTTSPEMAKVAFELASEMNRPISTHLSEMKHEIEFLDHGNEDVERLLRKAGAYDEEWKPPGVSPVRYFFDLGILGPNSYCVHLNYLLPGDIELLARSKIVHIYCPRSHAYFRHSRHPLLELQKAGIVSCLGTDSYGSNVDLSILGEAELLWQEFPQLSAKRVFEMFTTAGLGPLGLAGKIGELAPNAYADFAVWQNPEGENFDEILRWLVRQRTAGMTFREGRRVHEL